MILRKLKIGDHVRLFSNKQKILTIKDIKVEKVKIKKDWVVDFVRCYFEENHAPVYSWKIFEIVEEEDVRS